MSLVGNGMMIGGLIAAPFTLGTSLIVTAVGGGVSAVGTATSTGADVTEFCLSKRKMSEIQKVIKLDNELSKEIQELWKKIQIKCGEVAEEYSESADTILSVLLACCVKNIPLLGRVQKFVGGVSLGHAKDACSGPASGAGSVASVCSRMDKATGASTALVARFTKGSRVALFDTRKVEGLVRSVLKATKTLNFATKVTPVLSIGMSVGGAAIDIASLIFTARQIHKNSDGNAGKELIKLRDELEDSQKYFKDMYDAVSEVL